MSEAGDLNGDGIDDLLIGAYGARPNGFNSGASYVVFGASRVGAGGTLELSALDGSNGFVLNGVAPYTRTGYSVSKAGDVNGDGIDDLLIGTKNQSNTNNASYVVFGASGVGASGMIELSVLDGSNGFVINRERDKSRGSRSISAAGDINGDGIDDLLIGVENPAPNGLSQAYVIFGAKGVGTSGMLELAALNGSNGFVINGMDRTGSSVNAAGDVNGDGVGDLLIGAVGASPNGSFSGASYVVFGASGVGAGGTLELSTLDGSNGFVLNGVAEGDLSSHSLSTAGDVNGDGIDDLLIGAIGASPNGNASGASYVVFGQSDDNTPPDITATHNPTLPDGLFDWYVSDVALAWTIMDPESSFMIDQGCADQTITTDTDGLTLSCQASSAGGNHTVSFMLKRDATPPAVKLTTPENSAVYVLNQTVIADWSASDATLPGSGLALSSGSVNNGQPVDTGSLGNHSFAVTATDVAGNQTRLNHHYTVLNAAQTIPFLIDYVQALGLRHGLEKRMVKKLWKAKKSLAIGKTSKTTRKLNAFIKQVNSQSNRNIEAADAKALVTYSQLILSAI